MLVIRFFRTGKKNQPTFKIVVTEKTKPPRAGRFIEEVGFYNPSTKEKVLQRQSTISSRLRAIGEGSSRAKLK